MLRYSSHIKPPSTHPQTLNVIEFSYRLVKDVNYDIAAIYKHPLPILIPLYRQRLCAKNRELLDYAVRDALYLSVGAPSYYDEIISEVGNGMHV